ncbi:LysR family transcriptional regulator [Pseudomonas sp. F1_0610]|uniref:LysR family transcriptional regulator n=1 Tax=Pseudomonas sp. F1_0610 TaxID=3114284 RepID=UPI0039C154EB
MAQPVDLNLIYALSVLLDEGSVSNASYKLNLSKPAVSRILARIREQFNDPILVRAGRNLVPTPRALELREQIQPILDMCAGLNADRDFSPAKQERVFTIRANNVFMGAMAGDLLDSLRAQSPNSIFKFIAEVSANDDVLRRGQADLVIGSYPRWQPETKVQSLFTSCFKAVVRKDHPIIGKVTAENLVQYSHISVSRRGEGRGPIDEALQALGLVRPIHIIMPGFHSALFLLPDSDFILPLPIHVINSLKRVPIEYSVIDLPLDLPPVEISQAWHPRFDNDPGHRWLRQEIRKYFQPETII